MVGSRLYDLNGAGGMFDEHNYLRLAVNTYEGVTEMNGSYERWVMFKEHPAVGKYLHALFFAPFIFSMSEYERKVTIAGGLKPYRLPGELYNPGRYSSVLLAGLTVVLAYLFCAYFFSQSTGILASLILILLPNFVQFHKTVSLDAPTSFFFTAGAVLFAFAMKFDTKKWWVWLGVVSGLALATKFNLGLLFVFYCVVYLLLWKGPKMIKERKLNWHWGLFAVPFIALLVLYITWPFLWPAPVERMMFSVGHWEGGPGIEPWFGAMEEQGPKLHYFLVYFLFSTPLLVLLLWLASLHREWKKRTHWGIFVLLWFATPFLWSFMGQKTDGMRYLTMVYPPLAILVALGLKHVCKIPKRVVYGGAILLVYLLALNVWMHPYQLDYYNILVGGPRGVQEGNKLEFGWFGEGKKEAVEWINENAPPNVNVGAKWDPQHDFGGWRQDIQAFDLVHVPFEGDPTYLMMNHRYKQYVEAKDVQSIDLSTYRLVHSIKAGNGDIGWIYQRI
jgi:hypothetical protein